MWRRLHGFVTALLILNTVNSDIRAKRFEQKANISAFSHNTHIADTVVGRCLFDDMIFQIGREERRQLMQQIGTVEMKEHLSAMHSHSWAHCAFQGEICNCPTQVRFGHPGIEQRFFSEPMVCDKFAGCRIECDRKLFKISSRNETSSTIRCECFEQTKLTMKANSKTLLEEALFFLLRLTAKAKLIPSTGDRIRAGSALWLRREPKKNAQLFGAGWFDRDWNHMFLRDSVSLLNDVKGNCLEWGLRRTPRLPHCNSLYEFNLSRVKSDFGVREREVAEGEEFKWKPRFTVTSDIFTMYKTLHEFGIGLDIIFAEQVFEHVEDPFEAARSCFTALQPNGILLITVPHGTQLHVGPTFLDYFRFSKHALKYILETAGFCVPNVGFSGGGDFVFEVGRNLGLGREDFRSDEIELSYQRGFDNLSDGATNIMALAYKNHEKYCSDTQDARDEHRGQL